jgi:2-polyprenyl-3-methyl-5-hydroxy-6-metoxy-1,4-benzoquinol methylase
MKIEVLEPPRVFRTGRGEPIEIKDCARIALDANDQVTFTTETGGEYDVARKSWGFYATPSLNGRLLNFGLRAVLVRSHVGKHYLFLVERGHEAEFGSYLEAEQNAVVRWLDNDEDLQAIQPAGTGPTHAPVPLHCPCGGDRFTTVHMYFAPPEGEVRFPLGDAQYRREIFRCSLCGHFVSVHAMNAEALYTGQYVSSTYGDDAGMRKAFERIAGLPTERSDNAGRVRRVLELCGQHFGESNGPRTVLDVGSGLCVFLHRMKAAGWRCTALDPDPRAAHHAREVVGVNAVCGDWMTAKDVGEHDLITFNKVLEHVRDPIAMLARARNHLRPGGLVYVELPDGEAAAPPHGEGFGREEFFIEHYHVFSMASLARMAERAGFSTLALERLRDPSSKYTLRAFLVAKG